MTHQTVKHILVGALFLLSNCSMLPVSAGNRPGRIVWDDATRIRLFAWGNYTRMIETRGGELIAVTDGAGVRLTRSGDGGLTWSEPQTVVPNTAAHDMAVPDLMECGDGSLLLCYNPRPAHDNTDSTRLFGIRVRLSEDAGRTWGDEIFVHDAGHRFGDGCWEPSTVELPNGEIRLYFADEGEFTHSDEQCISFCRSRDGGRTWSKPERVSFRPGFRDGMPVPILLPECGEVLVSIEDNGYPHHLRHFQPTLLRTRTKGRTPVIGARSRRREYPLRERMEATATAGAPYLRRTATGETVLSYQSNAGRKLPLQADGFKIDRIGTLRMQVAVGNRRGRGFTHVCTPFEMPESPDADTASERRYYYGNWNSLCPTRDGGIWALTATNRYRTGSNECWGIKGWLLHDFTPRRIPEDESPVWDDAATPDLLVCATSAARMSVHTASDGKRLHLLVQATWPHPASPKAIAAIDFGTELKIRIRPNGAISCTGRHGETIFAGIVNTVEETASGGCRAEIAIDRNLLRKLGIRGRTPVQATLVYADNGTIRYERIAGTDTEPRSWLRIGL